MTFSAIGGRTDLGPESHPHQPCLPLPWKLVNMDRWMGWRGSRMMQTMPPVWSGVFMVEGMELHD